MSKILVVDDEEGIAELIKLLLEEQGHEVLCCYSGKSATEHIPLFEPEMIISDIKMAPMNGIELLHWCNASIDKIPFLFITGFSDILLLQEAIELGAYSLITKPFYEEEIIKVVNEALGLGENDSNKGRLKDDHFCKIDLQKFVSGSNVCCAIYVRIREDHFVKLADKNDPIPKEKLLEYQEKHLQFLYVLKSEFTELVGFSMTLLEAIKEKDKVPKEKVLNFINYSNSIILEQAFIKNLDREVLDEVENYSQMVLSLLVERKALYDMLSNLKEHSDFLYAHSLSTAVLCYLMAKKLRWNNEPTLFRVFMSGLLHDIGLRDFDEKLVLKNPALFTDEEKKSYESHPIKGMEILNQIGGIPDDVILAAYQHHESCLGSGFPQGLVKSSISPISRLVSVADIIDNEYRGNKSLEFNSYVNAIKSCEKNSPKKYDKLFLNALKSIFKMSE